MIIALGLYNSRDSLANMFEDEVKNPAKSAPAIPGVVQSDLPASGDHAPAVGGRL
jgi:hypothetical protein